jgi:hypothetical protein
VVHAVSMVACLVWLLRQGSGLTFFFDEWDFVLDRSFSIPDLLRPHNGHLSLLPVLAYDIMRKIFGLSFYVPYQVLGLLVHVSGCSAVYFLGKRRSPLLAVAAAVLVCLLGSGWQNIMWPFQIGMMGALSAGLWAIWEVTQPVISVKRLAILCAVSLLCAGGGIAAMGTVVLLVVARRQWNILPRLGVVGIAYGFWYLVYGTSQSQSGNLAKTPQFVYDSALGAASGIGAAGETFAYLFFLLLVVLALWNSYKKVSVLPALGTFAMALMTWIMTGLSRAHLGEPAASRYVYVGAALLVTSFVTMAPRLESMFLLLAVMLATNVLVQPNLTVLRAGTSGLRDVSINVKASLTGLDIIDDVVIPNQQLDGSRAPQIDIAKYKAMSEDYGNAGFSNAALMRQPELIKLRADDTTFRLMKSIIGTSSPVSCEPDPFNRIGDLVIGPGKSVFVLPQIVGKVSVAWFASGNEASPIIELSPGTQYQFKNSVVAGSPSMKLNFMGNNVLICR